MHGEFPQSCLLYFLIRTLQSNFPEVAQFCRLRSPSILWIPQLLGRKKNTHTTPTHKRVTGFRLAGLVSE
ncbi:hypothetical protein AMELA_G00255990 [Ameiurus melas]|uniref:Uncharacterized protein n=1 Tax=Ameiurus melas TaxID=219545 RepID=A0A7J5ZTE5_AMEME|nr:hypothetical protein AMELA_G00255990 [Ameiurus melas]